MAHRVGVGALELADVVALCLQLAPAELDELLTLIEVVIEVAGVLDGVPHRLQGLRLLGGHALQLKALSALPAVCLKLGHGGLKIVGDGEQEAVILIEVQIEGGVALCDGEAYRFFPQHREGVVVLVGPVATVGGKQVFVCSRRFIE